MTRSSDLGLSPGGKRPYVLPLNNPSLVPADKATHLRPDDLVVGVQVAGRVRAYPWWIFANHHVANDVVVLSDKPLGDFLSEESGANGRPLAPWFETVPLLVTLCEACAASAAYIPIFDDAPANPLVFTFAENNPATYSAIGTFTICDIETRSRWHPFTGRAHSGSLAGRELKRIPAFVEHWDEWRREFPLTEVVFAAEEMRNRFHVRNLPAVETDAAHTSTIVARKRSPELIDHRLGANELILGLGSNDGRQSMALRLSDLRQASGFLQFDFAGEPCLAVARGAYRGCVFNRRFKGDVLRFELVSSDPFQFLDSSNSIWNFVGEALSGHHVGGQLDMFADSYVSKWSEWSLSHPGALIKSVGDLARSEK